MCLVRVMWVGCLIQKRSPKCGILSSKLRSPVFKGRRRRWWGCGSVRAVSVWPAHVTCLLLRAMAVAQKQVNKATVSRAVSWCLRWCGEVRSQGPQGRGAELCSYLWLPSTPHIRNGPRGLFFSYARVYESWASFVFVFKWEVLSRQVYKQCLAFSEKKVQKDVNYFIQAKQDLFSHSKAV